MELQLNQDEGLRQLLYVFKINAGLNQDEKFEVRLVVRKTNMASKKKRIFIHESLSQETWEQILSFDFWKDRDKIVLGNYRKAQKYGELMISRDSALSGLFYARPMKDSELTQDWWTLNHSINRKFRKSGLDFRVKFSSGKYGVLNTKPAE